MMTARKDLPTEAWSAFSQIVEGMDAPTSQSNQGSANLASDEMKDVGVHYPFYLPVAYLF